MLTPEKILDDRLSTAILEDKLGYRVQNRQLLLMALTHSTFQYEAKQSQIMSFERLEFLGDSVLGLAIGNALYEGYPDLPEGKMSKARALVVCETTLYQVAKSIDLGQYLLMGKGEWQSGGCLKPSILSDCMEALFGCIFLDASFIVASEVIVNLLDSYVKLAAAGQLIYDYKSLLFERIQQQYHSSDLVFKLIEERGPAHAPWFVIDVLLKNIVLARGEGLSKKEAEQVASKQAIEVMG